MSGTSTPSPDDDSTTYDGPDDDLASGNITDADFAQPAPDASDDQVTRPSPGRDTRNQR
jgi:hypothetical protein